MKRLFGAVLISFIFVSLFFVANASANVNNFHISSFDVEMELSKDAENRSVLKTKETIVAEFPQIDQNRGITKELVRTYNGHSTSFKINSIKDQDGQAWDYNIEGDTLRIGRADKYVHGQQTYVIEYTQRDVTRHYSDTGRDEFYWDVIGNEWRVPIDKATVSLRLAGINKSRVGNSFCYYGPAGSGQKCRIDESDGLIKSEVNHLEKYSGVTLAVGFEDGTFAEYQMPPGEVVMLAVLSVLAILNVIGLILAIIFAAVFYIKRRRLLNTPEIAKIRSRAVVPQYLPPEGYSVLQSSQVMNGSVSGSALSGHIIDWAVRHLTTISQIDERSLFKRPNYRVEVIKDFPSRGGLTAMRAVVFGQKPAIGDSFTTKDLQSRARKVTSALYGQSSIIKNSSLYYVNPESSAYAKKMAKITRIVGFSTLSVAMVVLSFIISQHEHRREISPNGEELKKYLEGLKLYIELAEKERLKMLQAPGMAEKVGNVASDKGARIKLYERVLPYAILFGQEKQWTRELGRLYADTSTAPSWTTSDAAFNAAMFSSAISSFSSGVSSASSYSSDSGGSSGGGFSGGGGGGGGGGGW